MSEIQFVVPGQPVGKGRPKAVRRRKANGDEYVAIITPDKTANYEGLVAHAAHLAMNGRDLVTGACSVELDIRVMIPESWSNKRKALAANGALAPTKKPDNDNVEKGIFDGMNGVVWKDDVQVVQVTKRKRYAETPGVVVIVRELDMEFS